MKRTLPFIPLFALLLASCSTLMPGADPVLVNAERVTSISYDSFDSFFSLERNQEVYVKANLPAVHTFANSLRQNAPKYLGTARAATEAYRVNRDASNRANMQTAIAVLQSALAQVSNYTTQINAKGTNP